jgi:Protein of unknown function (DUF1376)
LKPDAYIPLYPRDFFDAIEGYSDAVGLGYLRAICHYWTHTHCKGLLNDSEYLRKICRIDMSGWVAAMGIIFDNNHFFTLGEDGLWHQSRASSEWEKSSEAYRNKTSRAKAGAAKKWKNYYAKLKSKQD